MLKNPNSWSRTALPPSPGISAGSKTHEEIVRYIEQRRKKIRAVKTTRTPSGQILDWVTIESQNKGGKIATPPPTGGPARGATPKGRNVGFELDDLSLERGPKGTVPILRKDASRLVAAGSLRRYLSKKGRDGRRSKERTHSAGPADPDPFGYFHATYGQSVTCFGCEGNLNAWQPYTQNPSDHSIVQTGLQNYNNSNPPQSLEAGWVVCQNVNGDLLNHLFTYYTTNGYTQDGDNLGGWNQDYDGWVQYDANVFPGATLVGMSTLGGPQWYTAIKYQLYAGNWWFQCNGIWLGYYPASLFSGTPGIANPPGSGSTLLDDHADWVAFWGEVFSTDSNPDVTTTQMGSGCFAEAGYSWACYMSNLEFQSDANGTMATLDGTISEEDAQLYDGLPAPGVADGYVFVGGPGAGPIYRSLVLTDNQEDGYSMDSYGYIHEIGNVSFPAPFSLWNWSIARGLVVRPDGQSGYVLDGWGAVHPWGNAPAPVNVTSWWPNWDIARGIVLRADGQSGYVLDGWGGVHPWGNAPAPVNVTGYWLNWDIARAIVLRPDGQSGYVLDGWGGIHPWGNAPAPVNVTGYWPGWDIVRAMVLCADGQSGYVLDGWGGIHPWGNAADIASSSYYTPGQDLATSITLTPDGTQGCILDQSGGVHAFTVS